MKATFKTLAAVTLDGKDYKKGDTFQADANFEGHFKDSGIAEKVEPKTEAKK